MGHDGGGAQDPLPTRTPARLRKHFLSRDAHSQRATTPLVTPANHSDGSGLVRSLALSFSRVAAARRIPVLPPSTSGIRDSSHAPDTRAGMTEKFDRADVRVTISCRPQIDDFLAAP